MNELRKTIQQLLDTIENISCGAEVPDDLLVKGTTYFSYSLNRTYLGSDYDNNYTYQVDLIGYIKNLFLLFIDNSRSFAYLPLIVNKLRITSARFGTSY